MIRRCEVCDRLADEGMRCTNGRCLDCHRRYCTGHGNQEVHGRGNLRAAQRDARARRARAAAREGKR